MRNFLAAGAALLFTVPGPAAAMEIKTAPSGYVLAHEANPGKGYFDLMAQTIVIHNDENAPVTLGALQIDVMGDNGEVLSKTVKPDAAARQTRKFAGMAAQGLGVFLNAQLLNVEGLAGIAGAGAGLADGTTLAPGEAALSTSHYFATDFHPASVAITVSYYGESGAAKTARLSLPVRMHASPIVYSAPLKGAWRISGFPNLRSHHRFIPSNEFALDFFSTGPGGALDQGAKRDPSDDYGYGAPVLAAADGEVVFLIDGQTQDPDALSRREGESVEDARARITQYQFQRFAEDFRAAATGNLIVLRHEAGGSVEYSSYGHLKEESIAVKLGDKVRKGDVMASVGNTGDSTLTHLHFQLNAGSDPFFSRSLPVAFDNGEPLYIGEEPGYFMIFSE